jgi:hypothetical protein
LLKQLEELISEEGGDEAQPIEGAKATQDEPKLTAKSEQDSSSPIESGKDPLESHRGVTEEFSGESLPPLEETVEVPDERGTPLSEPLDEFRLDAKKEPNNVSSELTDELLNSSLTHSQMVERLGVKSSTLSVAKKKPNFSEWSKSKDPDAIAWRWVVESKRFVALKNQGG